MLKIKTTCIGAYPKPEYVPIIDWFDKNEGDQDMTAARATQSYEERLAEAMIQLVDESNLTLLSYHCQ